ncbi:MAG: S1C family serine protease [Solirubrobacterales bacterium]
MSLTEIQQTIATLADQHRPSVVGVGRGWRLATGTVIAEGRVVTSAHRVRGDETTVSFAGDREQTARRLATDHDLGIAVLEVDTGDAPPLEWAETSPALGTAVVALADPGGHGLRASPGFVTAGDRTFRGPRGRRIEGAIEHTAALPRGSAGGPLLDTEGRLVGVNLLRLEGGLILALGVAAREAIDSLGRGERPQRGYLGVAVAPPYVAHKLQRALGLPERDGVLVRAVEEGSPADHGGLERGDLIITVGGREVDGIDTLHEVVGTAAGSLPLTVVRGAEERELEVAPAGEQS